MIKDIKERPIKRMNDAMRLDGSKEIELIIKMNKTLLEALSDYETILFCKGFSCGSLCCNIENENMIKEELKKLKNGGD